MPGSGLETRGDRVLATAAVLLVAVPSLALGAARPDLRLAAWAAGALLAVAVAAVAAARRQRVPVGLEAALPAAAGVLSLLQAVPWGPAIAAALGGPGTDRASASLAVAGLPGPWPYPSLDPWASLGEGLRLLAVAAVLAGLVVLARRRRNRRRLALAVGVAGLLQALVGLAGEAAGTPLRTLFLDAPQAAAPGFHGTFLNDNHTASLLLLSVFAWLGVAAEWKGRRRTAAGAAALVLALATVATGSRGGATVLWTVGLAYLLARSALAARGKRARPRTALRVLPVVGIVLAAAVAAVAVDLWLFRYADRSWWPDAWAGKTRAWEPTLRMVADHPWVGTGRGAFAATLTAYNDAGPQWTYDYVENLVLQALADWGIPAGAALALAGAALGVRLLAAAADWPLGLAAMSGVAAVFLKDLGDFSLEVPGVALPTLALLACAIAHRQHRADRGSGRAGGWKPLPALAAACVAAALLVPAALADGRSRESDRLPLAAQVARTATGEAVPESEVDAALAVAAGRHPADAAAFRLAATADLLAARPARALARADHALVLDPWSVPAALAGLQAARDAGLEAQVGPRLADVLERRPDAEAQVFAVLRAGRWPADALVTALDGPVLDRYLDFLAKARQPAEALRLLEARLARDPREVRTLARLGTLLLDTGDLAGGDQAATRLLGLDFDRPEGWSLAGRAAWARGAPLEALALFLEAAGRSDDPVDAQMQALRCLLVLDRRDEFDALARQVASRIGTDPYRRAALERALASRDARRGAWANALNYLDRAETMLPWDPEIRVAKALVRRDSGDREGALREARRALALDPGNPQAAAIQADLQGVTGPSGTPEAPVRTPPAPSPPGAAAPPAP